MFATAHAIVIVPIWNRMFGGLVIAALAGAVAGWTFVELYPRQSGESVARSTLAGARYGALLWLAVSPVTAVDAALRTVGVLPRFELVGVIVALALAATTGALMGRYRQGTRRAMIAGAAATVLMTMAMAGPVPIGRSTRAFLIFLAVLPAAIVAGAILGAVIGAAVRVPVELPVREQGTGKRERGN